VNPRRVALLGRGHGGFIALRALQEHPDKFRCAVAIDAPVDLAAWLKEQHWENREILPQLTRRWLGDEARLEAAPLVRAPEKISKPVLFLNYRGIPGDPSRPTYTATRDFARRIVAQGGHAESVDLSTDYMHGLPAARGAVFEEIEAFLNEHVYTPNVKIGDTIFQDVPTKP
jgi:pimeloyl-ACP methyl ester carboxylesterase